MAEKACGTCEHFHGSKPLPEGVPVPAFYNAAGQCWRDPTPVRKSPDGYYCGDWAPLPAADDAPPAKKGPAR